MPPQSSLRDFSIEDSESLQVGEVFGGYQVLCCLNYTILGGLYHVKEEQGESEYCLGVLPLRCSENEAFKQRFEQEVSKILEINHPNILKLLRWEELSGRLCLFYEAFDADNLNDSIEKRILKDIEAQEAPEPEPEPEPADSGKPKLKLKSGDIKKGPKPGEPAASSKKAQKEPLYTEEQAQKIGTQVLAGLHVAHQQKVYHWGLTPSQILVNAEGRVKIAGMGLQSMMGKDLFESLVSQAVIPVKMGKKRFMISEMDVFSPQRNKSQNLDHREDLYSFGVCLYSMLTGLRINTKQAYQAVLSELPAVSTGWDIFIQKCLQPDVGQRYHSAEAASRDLNELDALAKRGAEAAQEEALQPKAAPKAHKTKGLLVALIAGLLLCVGGAAVFFGLMGGEGSAKGPGQLHVSLAKEGQKANVHLTLPPQATLIFEGKPQPFSAEEGTLALVMDPGEHVLTVSAPDYKPKQMKLVVGDQHLNRTITLSPDWGLFEISTLSLVKVSLTDAEGSVIHEGTTDREGRLSIGDKLWKGRPYSLSLAKEGYQNREIEGIVIPKDAGVLKEFYKLAFSPGAIQVTSQPEGAKVFINGEASGVTPLSVGDLPVKKEIKLEARLEAHYPSEKTLVLSPGESLDVDLGVLEPKVGQAKLKILWDEGPLRREHAKGLTIQLDDAEPGPLTSFTFEGLLEGKHSIIVRHPDCKAAGARFVISENEETQVLVKLRPYPSILRVITIPQAAYTLFVDGRPRRPETDNLYSLRADKGRKLELRAPGYFPVEGTMDLKAKQSHDWRVELKKVPPPEMGSKYVMPDYKLDLTWVSPGTFMMGSPRKERQRLPEEGPLTKVTLTYGFWMGTYEVTQEQYEQVMGSNPSRFKGPKRPVESLTHDEAMQFCEKLTASEAKLGRLPKGYAYRLPLEAEWEFAARGGSTGPFSFGPRADFDQGNFRGTYPDSNRENPSRRQPETTSVGSFPPNPLGLFDMHGNVSEWGLEGYRARHPGKPVTDPVGPLSGREYVVRGGNFKEWADRARSAARSGLFPSARMPNVGMRIVLAPAQKEK